MGKVAAEQEAAFSCLMNENYHVSCHGKMILLKATPVHLARCARIYADVRAMGPGQVHDDPVQVAIPLQTG